MGSKTSPAWGLADFNAKPTIKSSDENHTPTKRWSTRHTPKIFFNGTSGTDGLKRREMLVPCAACQRNQKAYLILTPQTSARLLGAGSSTPFAARPRANSQNYVAASRGSNAPIRKNTCPSHKHATHRALWKTATPSTFAAPPCLLSGFPIAEPRELQHGANI